MQIKFSDIHTVLFADDDANIRLIVQMSLEGLTRWKVLLASSGKDAISLIEREKPDLLLLDVMMPDIDGVEVLTSIKQTSRNPVATIFMTAKVQNQEIKQYKSLGAMGVIIKPFHPMKLVDEIKKIVDSSNAHQING